MSPIQIILLVVLCLLIIKTLQNYRAKIISIREFFLWTSFWLLVVLVVIFPQATDALAQFLGIWRGADLIVYIALIVLFTFLFFILIRLEKIERNITKIVRKMALENEKSN